MRRRADAGGDRHAVAGGGVSGEVWCAWLVVVVRAGGRLAGPRISATLGVTAAWTRSDIPTFGLAWTVASRSQFTRLSFTRALVQFPCTAQVDYSQLHMGAHAVYSFLFSRYTP